MLRVDELNDLSEAEALRATWASLLGTTPGATFFQSLDWLETYWRHFGAGQRLRLLVVRDGAETTGIVPLTVLSEPSTLGPLRVLTYPLHYWGSFYGPIGPRPDEALAAALAHVGRTRRDWDLLDLRFAPADDRDPTRTTDVMTAAGMAPDASLTDRTAWVDLPSTIDAYFAERTSKWRNNYRRWLRRLEEAGRLEYRRYRPRGAAHGDDDPRWDLYDECEQIARRSWQGNSSTGTTITHESVRPFLRDAHVAACRAGAADVNLLQLDGRPLAFLYCYRHRESVFGLRIGYDESLARDGVGNVLYLHVIENSISRGDRLLDMGPGSIEAKRALASRIVPIYRRTWGNPRSWRGAAWRLRSTLRTWRRALRGVDVEIAEAHGGRPERAEATAG